MPGNRPRAQNAAKQICVNSHPYSGDNLILKRRAGYIERVCRECRNFQERTRRARARKAGRWPRSD